MINAAGAGAEKQLRFFPLELISYDPANLGSADAAGFGMADDGLIYAIKKPAGNHRHLPATEWICTHLAEMVGIAVPGCKCIKMIDGTHVFGSRWEGGVLRANTIDILTSNINDPILKMILPKIFAFDLFVHNEDRHPGNYLCRQTKGNQYVLLAFDYSRSLLFKWPMPDPPPAALSNTMATGKILNTHCNYDWDHAHKILDNLSQLPDNTVLNIINSMPPEWLDTTIKDDIITWWENRHNRITLIKGGIDNGKYL